MATAFVNPKMLTWARERSGFTVSVMAKKIGKTSQWVDELEAGERRMTFNQAQLFADKAYVPFGYLFLQQPPIDDLPIPDLRSINGAQPAQPSAELIDIVKIILQRQEWFKEFLLSQFFEVNEYVGRSKLSDSASEIVKDIRKVLDVPLYPNRGKFEDYYRELVSKIEGLGIMVMRESYIKHYTRPLNVEEFRGFAITDDVAPVIFVNHADAEGPRLFTLIHELCHIWLGQSGVSNGDPQTHRKEEVLCNAVAAEFLVPEDEFLKMWNEKAVNWEDNLPELVDHFRVSTWALARRALTLGKIAQEEYIAYIRDRQEEYRNREKSGQGGPGYYRLKGAQLSKIFSKAVTSEALNGNVLLRDAGKLLDVKPNKIESLAREIGI